MSPAAPLTPPVNTKAVQLCGSSASRFIVSTPNLAKLLNDTVVKEPVPLSFAASSYTAREKICLVVLGGDGKAEAATALFGLGKATNAVLTAMQNNVPVINESGLPALLSSNGCSAAQLASVRAALNPSRPTAPAASLFGAAQSLFGAGAGAEASEPPPEPPSRDIYIHFFGLLSCDDAGSALRNARHLMPPGAFQALLSSVVTDYVTVSQGERPVFYNRGCYFKKKYINALLSLNKLHWANVCHQHDIQVCSRDSQR